MLITTFLAIVDPGTALLVATAVATAAKGAGDYLSSKKAKKQAKMRSKEMKRETHAGILEEAQKRGLDLEAQRLSGSQKMGKRKAQSMQDTADIMRGALNI